MHQAACAQHGVAGVHCTGQHGAPLPSHHPPCMPDHALGCQPLQRRMWHRLPRRPDLLLRRLLGKSTHALQSAALQPPLLIHPSISAQQHHELALPGSFVCHSRTSCCLTQPPACHAAHTPSCQAATLMSRLIAEPRTQAVLQKWLIPHCSNTTPNTHSQCHAGCVQNTNEDEGNW